MLRRRARRGTASRTRITRQGLVRAPNRFHSSQINCRAGAGHIMISEQELTDLAKRVVGGLKAANTKLVLAESCTGGLVSAHFDSCSWCFRVAVRVGRRLPDRYKGPVARHFQVAFATARTGEPRSRIENGSRRSKRLPMLTSRRLSPGIWGPGRRRPKTAWSMRLLPAAAVRGKRSLARREV